MLELIPVRDQILDGQPADHSTQKLSVGHGVLDQILQKQLPNRSDLLRNVLAATSKTVQRLGDENPSNNR